jgi:hypothetical protein
MIYVKALAIIALICSIVWVIVDPGFESVLAALGSSLTLISAFYIEKRKARREQQYQSVSKSSIGIQTGGNVNIGNINGDKHVE